MKAKLIPKKDGFDYSKLLNKVIIAVIAIAIFIVLLATGQILFLLQIFGWIENQVRALTGLDMMLAKGITAVLVSLILLLPIGGLFFSFFPIPQKNKKIKQFTVFSIFALLFFASYFSSSNVFFDPTNGKPLKYYSITPQGEYKFYSSDGYDPITGDKLRSINKEVVINYLGNSNGGVASVANLETTTNPKNKEPLVGLGKYAKNYPVKFVNKTDRSVFVCITTYPLTDSLAFKTSTMLAKFVSANNSIVIDLIEGSHIFSYMGMDGICYGERSWGNILIGTNSRKYEKGDVPVAVIFSDKKGGDYLPLIVKIDNEPYLLDKTFSLTVLPVYDQAITLKIGSLMHNKERIDKESVRTYILMITLVLLGCLAIFWKTKPETIKIA
jgi:hypothetical protein